MAGMASIGPKRPTGRPPLGRTRVMYNPLIDPAIHSTLAEYAERAGGLGLATYVELVLADLLGVHSRFLPSVARPLPMPVPLAELARLEERISVEWCGGGMGRSRKPIRVDAELAAAITARSATVGVSTGQYVRGVLRLLAGHVPPEDYHAEWDSGPCPPAERGARLVGVC